LLSSDELTRGGGCADGRKEGVAVPTESEVTGGKLVRQGTNNELSVQIGGRHQRSLVKQEPETFSGKHIHIVTAVLLLVSC